LKERFYIFLKHDKQCYNHYVRYSQNKLQFRQLSTHTISQEILYIKEKIKSYEADLQIAKQKGDKQEVKLLMNLLIKLQEKENLLIANANSQGYNLSLLHCVLVVYVFLK
jgi:hypothetical protein